MENTTATYRISGQFPDGCEGYNIFDYLPEGADQLTFTSDSEAIAWAERNSKGKDLDGIEPTWEARETYNATIHNQNEERVEY